MCTLVRRSFTPLRGAHALLPIYIQVWIRQSRYTHIIFFTWAHFIVMCFSLADEHVRCKETHQGPVSLEDYMARLPPNKLNISISTSKQIADVAEIMEQWELISALLGISYAEAEEIKSNNPQHYAEQK